MATQQTPSSNGFIATDSKEIRTIMHRRTLHAQVPHLIPLLDALPPGSTVCDVGCGPGGISLDIAKRYPTLKIIGVDIEPNSIEIAKTDAATEKVDNVQYSTGDVMKLTSLASTPGFEALDGGCSLAYSHMVVMHTTNRSLAVSQMRLSLAPGGKLALKEGDTSSWFFHPCPAGVKRFLDSSKEILDAQGADAQCGRKLVFHALGAGFERDQIQASTGDMTFSSLHERSEWYGIISAFTTSTLANTSAFVKAAGLKGVEEWEDVRKGFEEWRNTEYGFGSMASPVVVCTR